MKTLEYKGYLGSIEYSKEDNCFFGEVLGLNKEVCITYEGLTGDELYNDFTAGIEHYLEDCQREGIKPYNGFLTIRMPAEIQSRAAIYAESHKTSIDAFVCDAIERRLEVVS
jgi:predicted HicB family RNase H-like nuclease